MIKYLAFTPVSLCLWIFSLPASSQNIDQPLLEWETKSINLGSILEEQGTVTAQYTFTNRSGRKLIIEEIMTDCGCTTADYTQDTLANEEKGQITVAFDPRSRGGSFSKSILVKVDDDPNMDTLVLEGFNVPFPTEAAKAYPIEKAGLGFRLPVIHMGNVYTNEPKVKQLDFFNFRDYPIQLSQIQDALPKHIQVRLNPAVVTAKTRGILEVSYSGEELGDLGFFEEDIQFTVLSDEKEALTFKLIANVFEYFAPTPLSEINQVPRLEIREMEVDLAKIDSKVPISRMITLQNKGQQDLHIRKVTANCDCVSILIPTNSISPGGRTDITVTFDPKDRKGIDHKAITIFSNDPVQPAQTVMVKSRIN
ncbi:MAG: DUF1573 domain-containing protein [Lunatimonas sp.]|uniref:DUF1573 domain-containing protein n=1 Tax=Lunatimonas sp. TaxID=2060141 RepID=UPI00263AFA08|nr:DUF1573 domain-containing protein [Lunatimonas sp.]MCC5939165.1 DUF1573 domain-containing protein [Lunatimonas sp.]